MTAFFILQNISSRMHLSNKARQISAAPLQKGFFDRKRLPLTVTSNLISRHHV